MNDELTLFHIEAGLSELMEARAEAFEAEYESQAERETAFAAIDQAIEQYAAREVSKVDGIRGYLRWAKVQESAARAEMAVQMARARQMESNAERLKQFCVSVLQQAGKKAVEGKTGKLSVQGNGGERPVIISDEALLPDSACKYVLSMSAEDYASLLHYAEVHGWHWDNHPDTKVSRTPSLTLIREALEKDCPNCNGHGKYCARCGETIECKCGDAAENGTCHACAGTRQAGVPGAHLGERGVHLRVK